MKIEIKTAKFHNRKRILTTYGIFVNGKFKKEFIVKSDAVNYVNKVKGGLK